MSDVVERRRSIRSDGRALITVRGIASELRARTGAGLPLRLWDGSTAGPDDAAFRIALCQPWSLRRLALHSTDLGTGEAYVEGDIDIEGDAVAAMDAGRRLSERYAGLGLGERLSLLRKVLSLPAIPARDHPRRAQLSGRRHSRDRDRAAIAFHYDLPNEFYAQFLDRDLVYSCAYFTDAGEELETAQTRKLDVLCRKLRLRPGARLLDIGCGWGSLLLHAARRYGAHATGVTLSAIQAEVGRERIAAAGLAGRVEIRLLDYRDVSGTFDAVASVGMFEHVGPERYQEYFDTVYRLTADGGMFCNHGICVGDPEDDAHETTRTFVGTYVFPDGGLAPAWRAVRETERAGFEVVDVEQLRPHYALTLRHWLQRLESNRAAVVAAAGDNGYRVWRAYMAGAILSFQLRSLGVVQVLGSKGADLPLGRRWMLPADG